MKRIFFLTFAVLMIVGLSVPTGGCAPDEPPDHNETVIEDVDDDLNDNEQFHEQDLKLPDPGLDRVSVSEALYERTSRRNFSPEGLDLNQVGNLLWAAGGVGVDGVSGATRTAPSAGGTYPLDIYLVAGIKIEGIEAGVYRYDHEGHALVPAAAGDRRGQLAASALGQGFIAEAPANIVLVAYYERTTGRYGDRGERYVHMDAGYASQNIYLMAEELGLGTVAVGAFDDAGIAAILETAGAPLKIMPVGRVE